MNSTLSSRIPPSSEEERSCFISEEEITLPYVVTREGSVRRVEINLPSVAARTSSSKKTRKHSTNNKRREEL